MLKVNVNPSIQTNRSVWQQFSPVILTHVAKINSALKSCGSFIIFGTSQLIATISKEKYFKAVAETHLAHAKACANLAGTVGFGSVAFAIFALGLLATYLRKGNAAPIPAKENIALTPAFIGEQDKEHTFTPEQVTMLNRMFSNTPYKFHDLPKLWSRDDPKVDGMEQPVMRGTQYINDGPLGYPDKIKKTFSYVAVKVQAQMRRPSSDQSDKVEKQILMIGLHRSKNVYIEPAYTFSKNYAALCERILPLMEHLATASQMALFLRGQEFVDVNGIKWSLSRN